MFDSGYDFFRSMLYEYGKEKAIQLAKDYLDMQIKNKDPEEHAFCCELYQAMKKAEGRKNNV